MNNHNKKTQKDSLAALRFETLGFSMMPMGMLPDLGEQPVPEVELASRERTPIRVRPSPLSIWVRRRFRRLKRLAGVAV